MYPQTYTSMPTSGDRLLETIALAYQYTPPQRGDATSVATMPYAPPLAPSLDRLPAFIIQADELDSCLAKSLVRTLDADIATNTIDLRAVEDSCKAQLSSRTRRPTRYFDSTTLQTEGDTSVLAIRIIEHAITFLQDAYDRELSQLEQYPFPNQRPDRALAVDDSLRVIIEMTQGGSLGLKTRKSTRERSYTSWLSQCRTAIPTGPSFLVVMVLCSSNAAHRRSPRDTGFCVPVY
ncbi:hypothetical protein CPB85DRAFT_1278910 [Mucidula mucida]|nr:hypothetical protein CPB85DRAFT_1278910 [Mucidula mucida]